VLSIEPIVLARIALGRLGLVGKGDERDRRPTQDELDCLVAGFEFNPYQKIPVGRIMHFAVATAIRQDEISRIECADFDLQKKMLLVRERKDPRRKNGNNQRIPLLDVTRQRRPSEGRTIHHRGRSNPGGVTYKLAVAIKRKWDLVFENFGRTVLYTLAELEAGDRRNLVICRSSKILNGNELGQRNDHESSSKPPIGSWVISRR
jgi:integrase